MSKLSRKQVGFRRQGLSAGVLWGRTSWRRQRGGSVVRGEQGVL